MVKRASVKDVARMANVSVGTVSNYLNKTKGLRPDTERQIAQAIAALDYKRNEIASSLRRARTDTLGIVLPNVSNPFYTSLFESAEAEARAHGQMLTLGVTHYDGTVLRKYLQNFGSRQFDGIIIDAYNTDAGEDVLVGLAAPAVVIEPPAEFRQHSTLRIDNFAAAREAVAHLVARGHRQIAVMTPSVRDDRYHGYRAALETAGIAPDARLAYEFGALALPVAEGSQQLLIAQGATAMAALLDRWPFTACFITLDIFALGALKVLHDRGLRVPADVALVGFDDIPAAAVTNPPLTTVAQPHWEMGRRAVELLLERVASSEPLEPTHLVLPHRLVQRQSA